MINKETLIKVENRDQSKVGYKIPELGGLRRQFEPKEIKEITMDELRKLSYIPGGKVLLSDYLIIHNDEAIEELLGEVAPEYYYTNEEIEHLLLEGTLPELLDCLDFAPQGVLDVVKQKAIKMKLNDIEKREAISEALGFDINNAIKIETEIEKEVGKPESTKKERRVNNTNTTGEKKERRVTESKYKIVK